MFGFNLDRKSIYIILVVLVLITIASSGTDFIFNTLLTLPGVILAICFHEFAHAFVATKLGDNTPRLQGRLTLDPKSHIDPFGIVLLIFAHIGWGKPVNVNPRNFNSNKSEESCMALVSLAGPIMNFLLALVLTIILSIMSVVGYKIPAVINFQAMRSSVFLIVYEIILNAIVVNIGLGVFNLIPIPPLDGEKIFRLVMPYRVKEWLDNNMQIIYIIFMILWFTDILSKLVSPVINFILLWYLKFGGWIVGLFI